MSDLSPLDRSNLAQAIRDSPQQFAEGLALGHAVPIAVRGIQRVHVAGVGGSALPAEVLRDYLASEIPITISRDYALAPKPDPHTLLFVNSYSGTTEETVSAFDEGVRSKVPVISMSHGGILEELAAEAHVPHVHLPPAIQPRYATGTYFAAMVGVLEQVGAIIGRGREIVDLGSWLGQIDLEATGKDIAEQIGTKRVPIIYAAERFATVAQGWKMRINENAKTQCFWNTFPEMNHNEMAGFTHMRMEPTFVMLRSPDDHSRVQKRMRVFTELVGSHAEVVDVEIPSAPFLFQTFATLLLGDWVSYHMALLSGIDPTPIALVDALKQRMARPD